MFPVVPEHKTKQNGRSYNTLEKKAYAWPAVWKCGEKTLQDLPLVQIRVFATSSKHPNEGFHLLLFGEL